MHLHTSRTFRISASATLLACGLALGLGCDDNRPRATTAAPVAPASQAAAAGPKEALAIALDQSKLGFVGRKLTGSHDGSFAKFGGKIELAGGKAEGSAVSIDIDMASLAAEPAKLLGHLKSPDFFDVEKFPKATFASTSVVAGGAGGATHTITGNLTLHGVTRSVSFPATIAVAADAVTANAEFSINRKEFGIVYPGMPDDLIKDDVSIKLSIKAPRKG